MFKKPLITVIFVLGSISAFAQVDTAGTKRYDGAQSGGDAASKDCCNHDGMRGNVDYDPADHVNVVDLTYMVDYLFEGGPEPPCLDEANVNGSGSGDINVADLTLLVDFLFFGGLPPAPCPGVGPCVDVIAPDEGECLQSDCDFNVTWDTWKSDPPQYVFLKYTVDGQYWQSIWNIPNTGSYTWHVPDACTENGILLLGAEGCLPDTVHFNIYVWGDIDGDCLLGASDVGAHYCLSFIPCYPKPECCIGYPLPPCWERAGDVDCSGQINFGDWTYLVDCLFGGGPCEFCCDYQKFIRESSDNTQIERRSGD